MTEQIIDKINFSEFEVQKYWSAPSTWSLEKKKNELTNRIFSGEWLGSRKVDGALYVLTKGMDGVITLRGRSKSVNGDYLDKWALVPHLQYFADQLPNGTCLLGEVYLPNKEGSKNTTTIMNCLPEKAIARQKEDANKLHYYVFDVMAFNGESFINKKACDRFQFLENLKMVTAPFVEIAVYYSGEKLWNELQTLLCDGYEGVVITKADSVYEPGKRPSKTTMKAKKELKDTIDCFFTGKVSPPAKEYTGKCIEEWIYWENIITKEKVNICKYDEYFKGAPWTPITKSYYNNWAGSLEIGVLKDGKVCPIGWISGLTEDIKANPEKVKGAVVEVTAMEKFDDTDGKGLRHAKIVNWRTDKTYKDCLWSQFE